MPTLAWVRFKENHTVGTHSFYSQAVSYSTDLTNL